MSRDFDYFNDSDPVVGDTPRFEGLWVHYPDNPQGTSHNFLYGKDDRGYDMDVGGTFLKLSGREFPVAEFDEHRDDSFDSPVKIYHGPDYYSQRDALRDFATSKQTLVVRDNRGHVIFGVAEGLSEKHVDSGSDFSFSVQRVHREIGSIT